MTSIAQGVNNNTLHGVYNLYKSGYNWQEISMDSDRFLRMEWGYSTNCMCTQRTKDWFQYVVRGK